MDLEEAGQTLQSCGSALFKLGFGITALMVLLTLIGTLF
jgi:hypothetical protein